LARVALVHLEEQAFTLLVAREPASNGILKVGNAIMYFQDGIEAELTDHGDQRIAVELSLLYLRKLPAHALGVPRFSVADRAVPLGRHAPVNRAAATLKFAAEAGGAASR